ncbi:hypoxia-inducible factor 1-alpha inhibitor-like isoform X2 [Babylonia areolata]|uniref:hypoxia-inducible factor 1-alpha inhibitor-like isoform X2 n=1 Tax=Babylonia areolata TaxID=304850 RepID=UPI003FD11E0A
MASASEKPTLSKVAASVNSYYFPVENIPRLSCHDPEAERLIKEEEPVILTDTDLVQSALHWSPDHLASHIGEGQFTVYSSRNKKFLYYDDKKFSKVPDFTPPTTRQEMTFQEFLRKVKAWKEGDPHMYLQQSLNDSVGPDVVQDFTHFNWKWIIGQQIKHKWGELTSNLLLAGMDGVITPVHYDEQQNFFAQVDFDNPDFERFPRLKELKGKEAILGPGDVLYLPVYWWHQVESVPGWGMTVSVNFWYKSGPTDKIVYPLKAHQKVAMMRNIEKMITEALSNPAEVPPMFRDMVLGRYT